MSALKYERELRKLILSLGLTIEVWEISSRNNLRITLCGPNKARETFFFSRSAGDRHAVKNNERDLRRFAQSAYASAAVATSAPSAWPFPKPRLDAPAVTPGSFVLKPHQRKVIDALVASAPASITPKSLVDMPSGIHNVTTPLIIEPLKTTEETKPMNTIVTPPTDTSKQVQRLDRKQFHALCKWLVANVQSGREITLVALAREASAALDMHIAESTMHDALELEEITLGEPRTVRTKVDRAQIIARELVRLMRAVGETPSPNLVAIVESRSQPEEA